MSKAHSRGRLDKGSSSSHNHGYNYNRTSSSGGTVEEKRPSVFDRLGTRRENTSNSSHYGAENPPGGNYKSKTDPYKTHSQTQRPCHSSTKRESPGRSRSRSVSPRLKKKAVQSSVTGKTKTPVRSLTSAREKEKSASRKSSPKRNPSSKSRGAVGKNSSKSRSTGTSKKKNAGKSKGKIRSSSLSSEGSTSRGSSSTSSTHTRTTSTTESSSSTAVSTTTESSVPSIKLKPAKKDKPKKKIKKKSRVSSSADKMRHSETPVKRQSVSSSVSSRDSRKDTVHHYKDASRSKSSGGSWQKSPTRTSNSYERRSFSKETTRVVNRDKDQIPPGRSYEHLSRAKDRIEEDSRKRRLSDDTYGGGSSEGNYGGHKRSRTVPSPPPKYKNSVGRRTPSPSPRRVPPDSSYSGHKFTRRERTPPRRSVSKERERLRIIRSPHRRPSFEDHHRRPESWVRSERHPPAPGYGGKPKDLDRERDRPFPPPHVGSGNNYDKPGYPQRDTSRPRDRFAPVRAAPALERGRIAPKHIELDRDRASVGKERPKEYELPRVVGRPPPLLGTGPPKPSLPIKSVQAPPRPTLDDTMARPAHGQGGKRQPRMIVKTKEDLQERYEEETIKQSRVDMWVDQTLHGNTRIIVDTFDSEKLPPKRPGDEIRTPSPDEIKDKCSSIGSMSGINLIESTTKPDASSEKLQLSDFSDDADDILTQEVKQPSPVRSDDASVKVAPSVEDSTPTAGVGGDIIMRTVENASADLDKESAPTVVSTSSIPPRNSFDRRYTTSLPSQSQTDDDILERMDFEEISDDELGEVENKVSIVDVFGVNWASLLSRDKSELPSNQSGSSDGRTVRQRWTPVHVFQQVGISRKLCGEALFQKVLAKIKDSQNVSPEDTKQATLLEEELEKPMCRRRRLERSSLLENYGLGPHSRALSAKRDMAVRRYLLNLPPKNLACLDFGNQASGPINAPQEQDFATELFKLSVTNYKNS